MLLLLKAFCSTSANVKIHHFSSLTEQILTSLESIISNILLGELK